MNKKLVIGIAAAIVIIGGIVATVSLKGKGGEEGGQSAAEVDTYSVESATTNNKVTFEIAKGLGYKAVDGTAKGSLILENEENNTKLTFYFKHASKSSIIGGEGAYKAGYYGYLEYKVNGHEACVVKKGEDNKATRVEFNMILGEDESNKRYDGVSVYLEYNGSDDESVNLEQLFAGEDIRKMLESMTYVAGE